MNAAPQVDGTASAQAYQIETPAVAAPMQNSTFGTVRHA